MVKFRGDHYSVQYLVTILYCNVGKKYDWDCRDILEISSYNKKEAIKEIKRYGWKKIKKHWHCPNCINKKHYKL